MKSSRRIHCVFPPKIMEEPLVYHLGKDFDIVPNIRRAVIAEDHGNMDIELVGEEDEIQRVIEYLRDRGVEVEVEESEQEA